MSNIIETLETKITQLKTLVLGGINEEGYRSSGLVRFPSYATKYTHFSEILGSAASTIGVPLIAVTASLTAAAIATALAIISAGTALLSPLIALAFGIQQAASLHFDYGASPEDSWGTYFKNLGSDLLSGTKSFSVTAGLSFASLLAFSVLTAGIAIVATLVGAGLLLAAAASALAFPAEIATRSVATAFSATSSFFSSATQARPLAQDESEQPVARIF